MNVPCEILPWDSEFFGVTIARVTSKRLDADSLVAVEAYATSHRVDCTYLLADPTCATTCRIVAMGGFYPVDVRIDLERTAIGNVNRGNPGIIVRPAIESDLALLAPVSRRAHVDSRFYFDGHFPESRCDDLFETWLRKSVNGWADATLVAERNGRAVGYITCHLDPDSVGRIGLVGVAESARGIGVGGTLIATAIDWMAGKSVRRITVATQGRNVAAQRLYQRAGFVTSALQIWFHRWHSQSQEDSATWRS